MKNKIQITIGDRPACSEPGCCSEEYISIEVNGKRFEYDTEFMYNHETKQYKRIIFDVLSGLNIVIDKNDITITEIP